MARMGRGGYRVSVRKSDEKNHLEDTDVDGRIILRWFLRKWDGGMNWIELDKDRDR